jgi:hypothetical protein
MTTTAAKVVAPSPAIAIRYLSRNSFAGEPVVAKRGSDAIPSNAIARPSKPITSGSTARATLAKLAPSTEPERVFVPSCTAVLEGEPVRLLVFDAPPDLCAEAILSAAGQTLAARAAAISARLGLPRSTTTIVTRRTSRPPLVCAEIR